MYAIIDIDGHRQYKVQAGQELEIDYRGVEQGAELVFDKVVACSDGSKLTLGSPFVSGAKVTAKVLGTFQGDKVVIQKFRRRKNFRRKTGHRQFFTRVQIGDITLA